MLASDPQHLEQISFVEDTRRILETIKNGQPSIVSPTYLIQTLKLAAPLPVDDTPYSRNVVYSGPEGEVMVAHWRENTKCHPHDHGDAQGRVFVLHGEFFEKNYHFNGNLVTHGEDTLYHVGAERRVNPGLIHSMSTRLGGVTLHLYAPGIEKMKVYDEQHRTIYTVTDQCGAWVPKQESFIINRESFDSHSLHN